MADKYVFQYDMGEEAGVFDILYADPDEVQISFYIGEMLEESDIRLKPGYTPHAFLHKVCPDCGELHTQAIVVGYEFETLSIPDIKTFIIALIDQVTNNQFFFIETRSHIDEMIKGYKK